MQRAEYFWDASNVQVWPTQAERLPGACRRLSATRACEPGRSRELFKRWWVPKSTGLTLLSCEMDVRVRGGYRLVSAGNAEPIAFFGKYLEVTPHSRLSWSNEESPDGAISTVTFEERGGKTRVVVHDLYPSKGSARRRHRLRKYKWIYRAVRATRRASCHPGRERGTAGILVRTKRTENPGLRSAGRSPQSYAVRFSIDLQPPAYLATDRERSSTIVNTFPRTPPKCSRSRRNHFHNRAEYAVRDSCWNSNAGHFRLSSAPACRR